ncbi:MAG: hypothetical protein Q4B02_07020 [Propionibacteriaceae bacterium]|nr:hypothetical protein [Propionibacteriaceae bacterium]
MSQEQHDDQAAPRPEDQQVSPGQAEPLEGEVVPGEAGQGKTNAERLGETTIKFATDAAYAVAGFAGLVGERAKAFYDEQRAEYAKTHPDVESPGAREFLEQLGSHLDRFVDEINRGFRELSEKGRDVVGRRTEQAETPKPEEPDHKPEGE